MKLIQLRIVLFIALFLIFSTFALISNELVPVLGMTLSALLIYKYEKFEYTSLSDKIVLQSEEIESLRSEMKEKTSLIESRLSAVQMTSGMLRKGISNRE